MHHHPDHEVELYKEDDAYTVVADLRAFDRDDVEVRWQDGRLVVHAEHPGDDSRATLFHRSVSLPREVVVEEIDATLDEGVLEVTLPTRGTGHPVGRSIDISE